MGLVAKGVSRIQAAAEVLRHRPPRCDPPPLYRLDTLRTAPEIFIVSRKKAADGDAADPGIATTCAPDGESRWCGEYTTALIAKLERIVFDRDDRRENHGKTECEAVAPHVRDVKIIELPGLPPKATSASGSSRRKYNNSMRALAGLAHAKKGPPYRKVCGTLVSYHRAQFESWLDSTPSF